MTPVDAEGDGASQDAIAVLVASETTTNDASVRTSASLGRRAEQSVDDDAEADEPAWMADIDARMATVRDMDVKAVNGEYMDNERSATQGDGADEDEDAPGQFEDIFDDRGETIVDLNESSMKTTSIMAFLETFALGPESLNGGRATPTMGEVLERVKSRRPDSLPEWTMTAAAAASAYQFAINKKRLAEQAASRLKEAKRKHAKLHAKADALDTQLHMLQYGKTPDGKPVKPNQIKNLPHQTRPRGKMPPPPSEHTSAIWTKALKKDVCHVCGEGESDYWHDDDEIVFCDGCDVQVHMSCYGVMALPEGQWFCRGCKEGVTNGPLVSCGTPRGICAMCPHPGGALVRVEPPSKRDVPWLSPGHHAHLACALYLPEVKVTLQKKGQSPVVDMTHTKLTRMNLKCSVCDEPGGCTQCAMHKCFHAFHPLCARGNGQVALRQAITGQPMAFCEGHSASEFEKQRFITCGYSEDGTTEHSRPSSVFWRENANTNAPAESQMPQTVLERIKDVKKAMKEDANKPKEGATDKVFQRATSAEAKRISIMTCTRHVFHSGRSSDDDETWKSFFMQLQRECRHLHPDEALRLNELNASLGEAEVKNALNVLAVNHPRIPQGEEMFADLAPWKYMKQHQIDAVHWMQNLFSLGLGGYLDFQSGLGKRLTALAFIQWTRDGLRDVGQHLILCPRETIHLWTADLHRWCTTLRSLTLVSETDERSEENAGKIRALAFDYLIVPYDRLHESEALKSTPYKSVICDEFPSDGGKSFKALFTAVAERRIQAGSTFFLGQSIINQAKWSEHGAIIFPDLCRHGRAPAVSSDSVDGIPQLLANLLRFTVTERVVEPPIKAVPLAKFSTINVKHPTDDLMHIFRAMRRHGQKVLVIGNSTESLAAVEEGMRSAKLEYARLDESEQPLGAALYAVARFSTMAENNISFLLCEEKNVRRQQGRLSNASTVLFLDGNFSDVIEASGAPREDRLWNVANRIWGLEPVKGTTNFVKIVDQNGKDVVWMRGSCSKEIPEDIPAYLTLTIEKIPINGNVPPEFTSKDVANWDAAVERKRVRDETEEPTWWTLHEHTCVYCNGAPGQCKNIPPAFLPPEKAGMKIRCVSCPRITSMGCAYLRSVPKSWKCPQHGCAACAKQAAPGHITFRCVSCHRAFCDSCSSGASFDAISYHPVWSPSGFTLPPYYEYVRCAICVDSLLADSTSARRAKQ